MRGENHVPFVLAQPVAHYLLSLKFLNTDPCNTCSRHTHTHTGMLVCVCVYPSGCAKECDRR